MKTREPLPLGLHFGLPEEDYHADPAFSGSGAKDMLVSALTYWVNSPLNPDKEDKETKATSTGKAFHTRLLEGTNAFEARYAVEPDPDDYEGVIAGGDALRERCKELGLKAGGTIMAMADRILEVDPEAVLWPKIMQDFNEGLGDREVISPALFNEISLRSRIVNMHDDARKALDGGFPEVSYFWIDPETGVRLKIRVDYLKTKALVDLKTFSNPMGMPLDTAVARAVANYRYHVSAVLYTAGVEDAKERIRVGRPCPVHAHSGSDSPPKDWFNAFANSDRHAFVFLFLESGSVPNVVLREFRQIETYAGMGASENAYWSAGEAGLRLAIDRYKACMDHYGPDNPWFDARPMRSFVDTDFPVWMMD